MTDPTRAKLIPVEGPADKGDPASAIEVQFNPVTLKVSLSNSLKANEKSQNTSAAQYVDKSASSLTVELIFDTTIEDEDVRNRTRAIAEAFMKPVESGDKQLAPKRCLFQWGAFEFVGIMQSFDETLDFFSPEGTPLRATLGLKLSEDRYQFRQGEAKKTERATPKLGTAGPAGAADAAREAGGDPRDWRDTALYNGLETPRLAAGVSLAVPGLGVAAALGGAGGTGAAAALGVSGGGLKVTGPKVDIAPPGFTYGASASLGTTIPGAFPAASLAAGTVPAATPTAVRATASIGFE